MLWLYISFILQIIIQKLYYENKNKEANKTSILINITNFVLIILFSYLYKDYVAIFITLIVDFTLILFCLYKNFKSYSLNIDFKIGENIKYTSFSILKNIGMFLVYGIGFGNSFSYGNEYISAINFESLTTDTHWDILESVDTASKIDLAENRFDYKKSLKNAYKLLAILIASIILMI